MRQTETVLFFSPPKGTDGESVPKDGEERREREDKVPVGVGEAYGREEEAEERQRWL